MTEASLSVHYGGSNVERPLSSKYNKPEGNDAWFYLDVGPWMYSEDSFHSDDEKFASVLLLDQRTVIIAFLLMVYTSVLLTMKLFITMHRLNRQTEHKTQIDEE